MPRIALFGAAGAIGRSLADALNQRGEQYRAVGRDRARLEKTFSSSNAEIVTWDPNDPASVRAAARGIDTLIYLVGVPYNNFELHPKTMQQTLDGAKLRPVDGKIALHLLVDRDQLDVFGNDGAVYQSYNVRPSELELIAEGRAVVERVTICRLGSIWR